MKTPFARTRMTDWSASDKQIEEELSALEGPVSGITDQMISQMGWISAILKGAILATLVAMYVYINSQNQLLLGAVCLTVGVLLGMMISFARFNDEALQYAKFMHRKEKLAEKMRLLEEAAHHCNKVS